MTLTVNLEDALADELRKEASDEHILPEELAHHLVSESLRQRIAAKRWQAQNQRRLQLIARRMNAPLSTDEANELHMLQSMVNEIAAPFDNVLLQTVAELRRDIEQLPRVPVP